MLDVGDGNQIHWETWGNPTGKPALIDHGGPGSGAKRGEPRSFDLTSYRVVRFDQRGCGRSVPHAGDPSVDMSVNTTAHLLRDMELLREHLGIGRWLLNGGSWGSTLILAYAESFPSRVSEIVIPAVTMSRRSEIDWLYNGVSRFFPAEWAQFRASVAGTGSVVADYAAAMESPSLATRSRVARAWCRWEDAVLSQEPSGSPTPYGDKAPTDMLAFVRICATYMANGMWLEDGVLLREAHRLAGIPGVLIHGWHDLGGPVRTAWELAQAWPDAELHVVYDAGHKGSATMRDLVRSALARFAST